MNAWCAARGMARGAVLPLDEGARVEELSRLGQWRDVLTPEQVARIEADHGPVMRRFGYLPAEG